MSSVIQRPKANEGLMVHPNPGMTHGIPVFFEPLDADKVTAATREHVRTVVLLDGERPLGRRWIVRTRQTFKMLEGNTVPFGDDPYFYACPDQNVTGHEVQYLVYVRGNPGPESRWQLAVAMLRQWCAQGTPRHDLGRIEPRYFEDESVALRLQTARPRVYQQKSRYVAKGD